MRKIITLCALCVSATAFPAERSDVVLTDGWLFAKGVPADDTGWQQVSVPHDWAIYGPFDINNDLQVKAVEQNGEKEATRKTGRTGGLPFIGKGEYKRTFEVADTAGRSITLLFDGAMSNAEVSVNGRHVITWPYGYNSFYATIDSVVKPGENTLHVKLENFEQQSRWYPGAGLYRNVHLITTDRVHIPVWGTYITTPSVKPDRASAEMTIAIEGAAPGEKLTVVTDIIDPEGNVVDTNTSQHTDYGQGLKQTFRIPYPKLWSPDSPVLYTARTSVKRGDETLDSYDTRFGVRTIEYIPDEGFYLNGELTKFRGVCNHHDLGPLGAAVNRSALRHQIALLKEMGANAIRTSHNMPAPELVELCDEMGMMLMVEPFDDWSMWPKSKNGYGKVFNEWAERDVTNMVRHFRNSPSVVMWSIGNEVPSQSWKGGGVHELLTLQNLVHSLDPTRPVTCGMDRVPTVLDNGFAAALDIPGFNYKPQHYDRAYAQLPQRLVLGSETASTVSSRGVYHFPVVIPGKKQILHDDNQSSSYDVENCAWSNIPDIDFAADDDKPWVIGQFVWTGFDYLGEPSPYDTDAWPSHSSVFGIIDLASLPKDRYWLYRSKWNETSPTLHVLPHWTWPGREGEVTPVYVYTSYPRAELYINGESQGIREKNDSTVMHRYRLMWNDTRYAPGELKVVAYDAGGNRADSVTVATAGRPAELRLSANVDSLTADGQDLAYITVTAVDRAGNPVPVADNMVTFEVNGAGKFEATANGDPTCLLSFQEPRMKLFSGAATAIVRAGNGPGMVTLRAKSKGLRQATITIPVK